MPGRPNLFGEKEFYPLEEPIVSCSGVHTLSLIELLSVTNIRHFGGTMEMHQQQTDYWYRHHSQDAFDASLCQQVRRSVDNVVATLITGCIPGWLITES